ncbi:unnamed protein product, partial [Sphacelaria rigidula]
TGTPPLGAAESNTAHATVTLATRQSLSVMVNATLEDSDEETGASAGDLIEYAVKIANAGTTTVFALDVSSSLLDAQAGRFVRVE